MINYHDLYDKIVVATSANKTFSISGLSTSYLLVTNADIAKRYNEYIANMHLEANRFGIEMTEMVYTYGQKWHRALCDKVKENMELTSEILKDTSARIMECDAGYLLWIKLDEKINVDMFVDKLSNDENVFIENGNRFVADYAGFVRINLATSTKNVKEAMKRFKKIYLEMLGE